MGLQLHSLFARTCFSNLSRHLIMPQYRTLQYLPDSCVSFSPLSSGRKYGKCIQLQIGRARDTCGTAMGRLKGPRLKVEQDSRPFRSLTDGLVHVGAPHLHVRLGVGILNTMKPKNIFTAQCSQGSNGFLLNWLSHELIARRLFSSNNAQKLQVPSSKGSGNIMGDGKNRHSNTAVKVLHGVPKRAKSLTARSSPNGGLQVSVPNQSVKMDGPMSGQSVIETVGTAKAEKHLSQDGKGSVQNVGRSLKKDMKLGISFPTASKCSNTTQNAEARVKHKRPSSTTDPSGAAKGKVSNQTSQQKKSNTTDATQSCQTSAQEIHRAGELPSLVADNLAVVHQSKTAPGQTSRKRTPRKKVTVMESGKVPTEQIKPPQVPNDKATSSAPSVTDSSRVQPVVEAGAPMKPGHNSKRKAPKKRFTATKSDKVATSSSAPSVTDSGRQQPVIKGGAPKKPGHSSKKKSPPKKISFSKSDKVPMEQSRPPQVPNNKVTSSRAQQPIVEGGTSMNLGSLFPPTGKSVLVVESLTKAKLIQNYLGDMFEVLPSYGHVRDLAGRSGSVRPDDDFSMVWEVPASAWTHLKSIKVALNGAKNLILASDPDREGEAIAWHITEMLKQQDALHEGINVARVAFNEITESSIKSALQAPRDINVNLVHAYLARRALDYLIGFNISPLLWRKLPGCQSAGRVQSAALALICDREMEIDEFKAQEYWTFEVEFHKMDSNSLAKSVSFPSQITDFDSKKLERFTISCQEDANVVAQKVSSSKFKVVGTKRDEMQKKSPAPYITSSLQQDAANKLHFGAASTMKLAQKLYEGVKISSNESTGLITYMRTDGQHVSDEAVKDIRSLIIERHGQAFASKSTKFFKKVKNAQEAHEAIRPTNIRRLPSMLVGILDEDSLKLYTLIWCRTMASQMEAAVIDLIKVDIGDGEGTMALRSTASIVGFLGYQAVYKDGEADAIGHDDNKGNSRNEAFNVLCTLQSGDQVRFGKVDVKQHHTQPPPRYSEGALVKKMEELGIGRPSTYATIMKVLQDRKYVAIKSRVLYPEFRGRMLSAFLSHHFSEVTDYSFTADMESELDNVSVGTTKWKGLLKDYWARFSTYCDRAGKVDIRQVEKMLGETFGDFLFSSLPDKSRTCPSCLEGTLIFKVSRFGAGYFIGCDQHPKCKHIAQMIFSEDDDDDTPEKPDRSFEPKLLGLNPDSKEKIYLKNGPYGFYIQLGDDRKGCSPKRQSLSQMKDVSSISLEDALEVLRYPITLGNHPEDQHPVLLRLSKFGFSIKHRRTIAPVPKNIKPQDITLKKAIKFLSSKNAKQTGRPKAKPKGDEAMEAF
ncbi:DNA topoisomerase, type IA, core [Tasmannia lanceolata]|uniref:DNA topoisomerase, type IA, core n=1 Tax=Tasmannia lanceolata TaxID=3420 RepID=UPI0040644325